MNKYDNKLGVDMLKENEASNKKRIDEEWKPGYAMVAFIISLLALPFIIAVFQTCAG